MAQKFFLFKRKDPAVSGGAVFSDNGKGISVVSFPASNLAYMAADKGNITLYFNDSAPFEENSLTLAGESFEKTSVTVSCNSGDEVDLMEDIINFINRDTAKNVMKFDATGVENTFGLKNATPSIDAKVRARPVERGIVGTDAIVTGLDAAAVINGIDFQSADNLPYADFEPDSQLGLIDGETLRKNGSVVSISNGATGSYTATPGDYSPAVRDADRICSKKTLDFNVEGVLEFDVNITSGAIYTSVTTPNLGDLDSIIVSIVRDGLTLGTGSISDGQIPTDRRPAFKISTDASANVTDFRVTYVGQSLKVGDILTITFDASNVVVLTLNKSHFPSSFTSNHLTFLGQLDAINNVVPSMPHVDYTLFMVFARPNKSLLDPLYASYINTDATSTFKQCMGPFPYRSLGNEFQFNHNEADSLTSYSALKEGKNLKSLEPFSNYVKFQESIESSEENLEVIVIRRSKTGAVYAYDKDGEQVGYQDPSIDRSGGLVLGKFGMVLPYNYGEPAVRIARFGAISKDVGDLVSRNIATQLFNRFKVPLDR
jgi:hypothetical protein